MRVLLLGLLVACSPKVDTTPRAFDEDLPRAAPPAATAGAPVEAAPRPEAPKGKGVRRGTIARAALLATLDAGPGTFLRQLEVTPQKRGDAFVGWQLVQFLDAKTPLLAVDLAPGDVLLSINHQTLARPDQFQALWDSLRTADTLTAELWRGDGKFELAFAIDPPAAAPHPKTAAN